MRSLAILPTALLAAATVAAEPAACKGTISGIVTGKFDCVVTLKEVGDGLALFDVQPRGPVDGVQSYAPGSFQIPLPVEARSYTLDELGQGRASLIDGEGTLYSATKTTRQRGDVTIALQSLKKDPKAPGTWSVHGSYRARLLPAGSASTSEVFVDVKF
jgi:hypothetical protein